MIFPDGCPSHDLLIQADLGLITKAHWADIPVCPAVQSLSFLGSPDFRTIKDALARPLERGGLRIRTRN